jgi:hypothetical protein
MGVEAPPVTALTYRQLSAMPPPVREQLVLAPDGALVAWRSNGPEVGRFRGRSEDARRIEALGRAALHSPPPRPGLVSPDALFEIVEIGSLTVSLGTDSSVDGPWGSLLEACREIVEHPGEPLAAVTIALDAPNRLRLEHRGTEPVRVGLGAVAAAATSYRDGAQVVTASARLADGVVEARPGWALPIELEPADASWEGAAVSVSFNLDDAGVWIPVRCEVSASGPGDPTVLSR